MGLYFALLKRQIQKVMENIPKAVLVLSDQAKGQGRAKEWLGKPAEHRP